jgi:phosphonopyruvate decarboxylase
MISPEFFVETLKKKQICFYTGVPDSLLKNVCAYITDHQSADHHIIAANEGGAIGLATGYYLATGKIPVVYMQNSGIGNAVNPLLSLTDKEVYNVPILLLIGWRGEPGVKDEPQHVKQGKVTVSLLESMGISNLVLSRDENIFEQQLNEALVCLNERKESFAFVIRKDTFDDYKIQNSCELPFEMSREYAIRKVASYIKVRDVVVATTGMISRELFEYREQSNQKHEQDFLTVGAMGHASQIALGIALQQKNRNVYCFDGDGAALMHMGALAIIGSITLSNFIHIIFNNGAHDSVGGQPTVGFNINLSQIAIASGYKTVVSVDDFQSLTLFLNNLENVEKPVFLEVRVKKGARKDLGRPTTSPIQNKELLMQFLESD